MVVAAGPWTCTRMLVPEKVTAGVGQVPGGAPALVPRGSLLVVDPWVTMVPALLRNALARFHFAAFAPRVSLDHDVDAILSICDSGRDGGDCGVCRVGRGDLVFGAEHLIARDAPCAGRAIAGERKNGRPVSLLPLLECGRLRRVRLDDELRRVARAREGERSGGADDGGDRLHNKYVDHAITSSRCD